MKRILLIATGGTIACTKTEQGLAPGLDPEELMAYIPDASSICHVDTLQLLSIDSTNIQPEHWLMMEQALEENYEKYDGFVVTHGTDTLTYTAAALSYLIQGSRKPIVVTGAQKPIDAYITDARKNLRDSLRYASEDCASGVTIVFDGKAILGTRGKKTRSKSYSAMESINYPCLAFIGDDRITHYLHGGNGAGSAAYNAGAGRRCGAGKSADSAADPRSTAGEPETGGPVFYRGLYPRIFTLKLTPGMEPDVLDYIGERYAGIVIESYGAGGLPFHDQRNFLEKLECLSDQGKIVVITTQVMLEGSDLSIYEVGLRALKNYPVLQAYDMTLEAVVTKLMWILAVTRDFARVKELFYTAVNEDILL
ncbi:asparaginase [Bacilliculturomica massiliensis]|uniref:asparaginase n=1 Tax=Bacilliculturomica massiliensis TaxID=1917867 RepID=UPI001031AE87|nr:asparaginase [Bacilliculturomica massiliensis]